MTHVSPKIVQELLRSPRGPQHPGGRVERSERAGIMTVCAIVTLLGWLYSCQLLPFGSLWTQREHLLDYGIGALHWRKCAERDHALSQCGNITVPLDYFDPQAGTAQIALARFPATKLPKKGMILFNPGGPGGSGKRMVAALGAVLQKLLGDEYDIVGFDPRGVGDSTPKTKCFTGSTSFAQFKRNTILDRSYDLSSNMSMSEARKTLIAQHKEAEALYKAQFRVCEETMGDKLKYMGTSTVVRDIDFITKQLEGEDALVNFYGISYGSILGQYLVNMLPDRVGKVAIDGIADAVAWANTPYYLWYREWLSSTSATYDIFLKRCSEVGPTACALAVEKGENPPAIRDRIESFIDSLYYEPLAVHGSLAPGILSAGRVRLYLLSSLQSPGKWPQVSNELQQAIQGDGSAILNSLIRSDSDLARSAVSCNDNTPFNAPPPEVVIDELLDVFNTVSSFVFSVVTSEPDAGCQNWPVSPPERFQGPWNNTLRNPILVLSNTADPVTPLRSGELVQERLGNSSRLVIQDSPGHCTLAMYSQCTVDILQGFFFDGTLSLPKAGTICSTDTPPFPDKITTTSDRGRKAEAVRIISEAVNLARRGLPLITA